MKSLQFYRIFRVLRNLLDFKEYLELQESLRFLRIFKASENIQGLKEYLGF